MSDSAIFEPVPRKPLPVDAFKLNENFQKKMIHLLSETSIKRRLRDLIPH
jgi:hypothetical protein